MCIHLYSDKEQHKILKRLPEEGVYYKALVRIDDFIYKYASYFFTKLWKQGTNIIEENNQKPYNSDVITGGGHFFRSLEDAKQWGFWYIWPDPQFVIVKARIKKKHITHVGTTRPSKDENITVIANKARIIGEVNRSI